MVKRLRVDLIAVGLLVFCVTPLFAEDESEESLYRFDPTLTVAEPRPPDVTQDPAVVVDQDGRQTNLRLQTGLPLTPYLGAERGPELSPEERRLLPAEQARDGLAGYRLETGVGLFVEDRTSLSLGYRFHDPPSLLDERRNDPLNLSGDLRIGFDVKVPFD
jgi:hypothetical protein